MIIDNKTRVELITHSPLSTVILATRICRDSASESDTRLESPTSSLGEKDRKLISNRVLGLNRKHNPLNPPHESVLEHVSYTFMARFSRDVLQELSRHRIASESVQSTRAALKKLFKGIDTKNRERLRDFIFQVTPEDTKGKTQLANEINEDNIDQLVKAINRGRQGAPNDAVKGMLPGNFMTQAVYTINVRSFRNFLALRTSKAALRGIRELAFAMFAVIPTEHCFLFYDRIHWPAAPWPRSTP